MTAATAHPLPLLLPFLLLLSRHASAAAAAAPCAPPLTCVAERVRAHLHRVKALLRHPAKDGDRDIVASLSAAEALVDPASRPGKHPSPTLLLSAEVHFSTGQWRRTRGRYSLAYASYSAALAANPAYVPALLNAAQAAAAINATDAAALLGRAVSVRPLRKVTAHTHAHTPTHTHTRTHTHVRTHTLLPWPHINSASHAMLCPMSSASAWAQGCSQCLVPGLHLVHHSKRPPAFES